MDYQTEPLSKTFNFPTKGGEIWRKKHPIVYSSLFPHPRSKRILIPPLLKHPFFTDIFQLVIRFTSCDLDFHQTKKRKILIRYYQLRSKDLSFSQTLNGSNPNRTQCPLASPSFQSSRGFLSLPIMNRWKPNKDEE